MRPIVLALCLLASAAAAFGQQQPQRYRLERIIVEGSGVDDTIVRGEARLREEQMYTDADFREAVGRVRRLPFVVDATYRIEPGVTAGGTTLVVRILDVYYAFVDFTGSAARNADGDTVRDGSVLLGGRALLNNLGVIEGAVEKSDNGDGFNVGLAYRAYDIIGTGAFATAVLSQRFKTELRDYDPTMAVTVGYPLTRRQTVTFTGAKSGSSVTRDFDLNNDDDDDDDDDTDREDNFDLTDDAAFNYATLQWWYETIDDPFFATRGVQVAFGPSWGQSEFTFQNWNLVTRRIDITESATEAYGLNLDASVYQKLFPRTVGFVRLNGSGTREQETELETRNGAVRAGLGFDFHTQSETVIRPWKARLEIGAAYRMTDLTRPDLPGVSFNDTAAEAAFVFRSRWGTVRLLGTYLTD
ncbi:MAG TPA: hypothetical protein VNI54_17680 [Thermoanaerobaculia bacterium]|nr:hypothetical protein [Thermoanaerobaculia bacterium]